ncbi:MAG: DEAD/DEAH box helicase [Actinobacteria bacterium]|nr:DEAD/DEAH box helicase [Actinomycetota bacterium]
MALTFDQRSANVSQLGGVAAVFVPADPPRLSRLALWQPGEIGQAPELGGLVISRRETIELVLRAGSSARRRKVCASTISVNNAIDLIASVPLTDDLHPALVAWASAFRFGLSLVARGRLAPRMTPAGFDAWSAGPFDAADEERLDTLARAFPPEAHAVPLPTRRSGPLRVHTARELVGSAVDAVADAMVRTAAAPIVSHSHAFAALEPTVVADFPGWLDASAHGTARGGVRPVLRLDIDSLPGAIVNGGDEDEPDDVTPPIAAKLQLRSAVDPSLIVDAADLWDAPAAVLARLGDEAETDLLLALRRGAKVWPPLERALDDARPSSITLDDDEVGELFGSAAERLASVGFDVLWPSAAVSGSLTMKAVATTPSPDNIVGAGLDLGALLDFGWRVALDGSELSADELASLAEAKRSLVRLRGRWVMADPAMLEKLRQPPRKLRANDGLAAALSGTIDIDGEPVEIEVQGPLAGLAGRLRALDSPRELGEPDGLDAVLRPYQRRGLAWLAEMTDLGVGGCLADDMGLGKTIQLIALHLYRARRAGPSGPTLVVCPASLLGNWEREIERFAPAVPVRRYHGGDRHLDQVETDEIVLATYGMVRRDREALASVPWDLVVADEAQHVKNPLARTARELRAIPATARLALTGTPVENRLSELWAILDWTTPGLLGGLDDFRRNVAIPIERHRDPDATERFARLVHPFLLRRKKSDPAIAPELPPKTETDNIVPLTDEQVTLYEALARDTLDEIAHAEGIARRGLVLKLITGLKQITNHPANFLHESGPMEGRSGKLSALDELLDVIVDEGESVLVFSQYVEMGKLLEAHLASRSVPTLFLHGRVPVAKRQAMVDSFQAGDVPVFLLSLKAAGVGLNLTAASHVVHYDRWWNPAVEDQATDRAYRIGQDKPVQVHRLVSEGTIEDRIATLLRTKRELADAVVGTGEAWLTELSDQDLSELVTLDRSRQGRS